jgi:hypothetical protein
VCANRAEIVEDVRTQLREYVEFRKRVGDDITYRKALMDHRDAILDNLRDDPDGPWQDRLSLLNELVREEGM